MPRTVQRAHKLRLYPTAEQRRRLDAYFGAARWVWNRALEFRSKAYRRRGESVTGTDFSRLLTRLKHTSRYGWLCETPATVLTQKLRDQDQAFRNFFDDRAGYPKFRKRRAEQSIRFQLDQRRIERTFDANDRRLVLPGLGRLKLKWSRRPHCPRCTDEPGCSRCPKPKMVTLRRDAAGRYFVSFMVEEALAASRTAPAPNAIGAVDLGLSSLIVDAEGHRVAPLRALQQRLRQLRRADRVLKRRRRGSGRYRAQQRRIARLHAKVADARANFLHQASRRIVDENQVLVTETLNVRGMMRNRCLARAIADAGWGELRRQIAYKAQWAQRTHIEVDPWFPSTRRCSACHAHSEGLTLADRHWRCGSCGAEHDRDVNAACNLEQEGLRLLTGQRPAGPGRLMRVEGNTPGPPPARSGSGSVPDEARTDSTRTRRYGTAEAA